MFHAVFAPEPPEPRTTHAAPTKSNRLRTWAALITAGSAALLLAPMIVAGSNLAISHTDFGFPLTFARVYGPGPLLLLQIVLAEDSLVRSFFWRALTFDVGFAALAIIASAFSIYWWTLSWNARRFVSFYLAVVAVDIPMLIELPVPIGWVYLLVLLLVLPVFLVSAVLYTAWSCATYLAGKRFAPLACVPAIAFCIASVYWALPHDPYLNPSTADLPLLLERRSNANPYVRLLALRAMARLEVKGEDVVNSIVKSIDDEDGSVRMEAMSIASRLGPASIKAVPALVAALHDERHNFLVAQALGQIGPDAKDAIPSLRAELPGAEGYMKLEVARALWLIEGDTTLSISALIDLLGDDFGPIRRDAASALGQIGPPAKAAAPKLIEMVRYVPAPLASHNADVSQADTDTAVPIPRQMSDQEFYPQIRTAAADALRKMDPDFVAVPHADIR